MYIYPSTLILVIESAIANKVILKITILILTKKTATIAVVYVLALYPGVFLLLLICYSISLI